jgi:hypothetical protein
MKISILLFVIAAAVAPILPCNLFAQADTITIIGSNFLPTTQIRMNGAVLMSRFVSSSELRAAVPAGTPVGTYPITVFTAGPGGGVSSALALDIAGANTGNVAFVTSYRIQSQMYAEPRGAIMGKDNAFMPFWKTPQDINQTITTTVFADGGFKTEIIDNDVTAPIGSAITRPKRILVQTQDSSISSFDNNNQLLRTTRVSFLPSFRDAIANLQDAAAISTSGTLLSGLSAMPGSPTAVIDFINRLRNGTPPLTPDTEDAMYATLTIRNSVMNNNQVPPNATAKVLLNKVNNTIETVELLLGSDMVAKTFFKYKTIAPQLEVFDVILTEGYYTTPDNTLMKSVLAMQMQDITFSNYVRCIPRN